MLRRLRLISGLTLFIYVLTHLLNLVPGLVSFAALEAGREIFVSFWRGLIPSVLLYAALLVHLCLAYYAIFKRDRLAMPPLDALRYFFGVLIIPLAALHILGTRLAHEIYGVDDDYLYVVTVQWAFNWSDAAQQVLLVLVVWIHGCIGLHLWLRLKRWYPRAAPYGLTAAVLLPTLALGGYLAAGREGLRRAPQDPEFVAATLAHRAVLSAAERAEVLALREASTALGRWRLDDCTLVVTLEPCAMCAGATVLARLGTLVFGADDPKAGAVGALWDIPRDPRLNHLVEVVRGGRADECGELLKAFFRARRG